MFGGVNEVKASQQERFESNMSTKKKKKRKQEIPEWTINENGEDEGAGESKQQVGEITEIPGVKWRPLPQVIKSPLRPGYRCCMAWLGAHKTTAASPSARANEWIPNDNRHKDDKGAGIKLTWCNYKQGNVSDKQLQGCFKRRWNVGVRALVTRRGGDTNSRWTPPPGGEIKVRRGESNEN